MFRKKISPFGLFLLLVLVAVACKEKPKESVSTAIMALQDSTDAQGIQRMQSSKTEIEIEFRGKNYHSYVFRSPEEKLPHVTNGLGDVYMDNSIVLRLTAEGGKKIFDKTFTKNDFSSFVDSAFLARAVLEGIVYDKTSAGGFVYAASVCYPQTDLYVPLSLTITPQGKLEVRRVENLEENPGDEIKE